MDVFKKFKTLNISITLNISETFLKYGSNLDVFNMSKTSKHVHFKYIFKTLLSGQICYQDADREEGIVGVDYTGINNYIIIT